MRVVIFLAVASLAMPHLPTKGLEKVNGKTQNQTRESNAQQQRNKAKAAASQKAATGATKNGNQQQGNQSARKTGKNGNGNTINTLRNAGDGLNQAQNRAGNTATIVEDFVAPSQNNPTPLQFRVSVPAQQDPSLGLNVLLHGDGGTSFFDMPNAGIQNNLIGVTVLAPNPTMQWGGPDNARSQGPEHVTLVADLINNVLPQMVQFDPQKVFFTGVSGGALTLTSAMIPLFGDQFNAGMYILCGGLAPPGNLDASKVPARLHFQTTGDELNSLKTEIPQAATKIEQSLLDSGLSQQEVNQRFTIDGTPNGGHCEFDNQGFVSGIQLALDNFGSIMLQNEGVQMTGGQLLGIGGNENPF